VHRHVQCARGLHACNHSSTRVVVMSSSSNRRMASLVGHIHSHQPSPPEGAAPSAVAGFSGTGPTAHGLAHRPTVTGANGMVACAHSLAAQAGLRILANGGNAIDAGVAVAAALNVVEPFMSGIARTRHRPTPR
jgi:hypothetical protein